MVKSFRWCPKQKICTLPWCFATHNRAVEHTESCQHNLVSIFLNEITVMLGRWRLFLATYCSFQYVEYIYYVSSEKAPCFTKTDVIKSWPVGQPAKQVGIMNVYDCNIHYSKTLRGKSSIMFKRKQVLCSDLMTGIKYDENVHISTVGDSLIKKHFRPSFLKT